MSFHLILHHHRNLVQAVKATEAVQGEGIKSQDGGSVGSQVETTMPQFQRRRPALRRFRLRTFRSVSMFVEQSWLFSPMGVACRGFVWSSSMPAGSIKPGGRCKDFCGTLLQCNTVPVGFLFLRIFWITLLLRAHESGAETQRREKTERSKSRKLNCLECHFSPPPCAWGFEPVSFSWNLTHDVLTLN